MPIPRPLLAAAFTVCVGVTAARGQAPSTGTITGTVRRALDSLPVASAEVMLDSSGLTLLTDSTGAFTIRRVSVGAYAVHVRAVGYTPLTAQLQVSSAQPNRLVIDLGRVAQDLVPVVVNGRKIEVLARYRGLAERVDKNHGVLFTADEVSPLDRTRDVLLSLAGVHVNDRGIQFARCQDSGTLPGIFGGTGHATAKAQVYVDGIHEASADVGQVLDSINPAAIAYIEVYTGVGRIPVEYLADACAVVAIWTKAY